MSSTPIEKVLAAHGGVSKAARATGIPEKTFWRWSDPKQNPDGSIPIRRAAQLFYDALDRGLQLSWDDLRPSREAVGMTAPEAGVIPVTVVAAAAAAFELPADGVFETPVDHPVRTAIGCAVAIAYGWPPEFIAGQVQLPEPADGALRQAFERMDGDQLFRVQVMLLSREARLSAAAALCAAEPDEVPA